MNSWISTILTFQRRWKGNGARPLSGEDEKRVGGSKKDSIVDILISNNYMLKTPGRIVT